MRRFVSLLTALTMLFAPVRALAQSEKPTLTASGAILIEATTRRVLLAHHADAVLPMASTTKIMTALVALRYGRLSDVITVSSLAHGTEGSSMYLDAGERQTLENLLYGLMLKSGNDAAVAIAQHIGGSAAGFVALMNRQAEEMGLEHTHFENPHGLPAEGHVTTARELAIIAAEAMTHPFFAEVVATRKKNVPWDGKPWDRVMGNGNKLLQSYEGANGIKTGYTKQAGRCLVAGAQRDGMQLIAVTLHCGPMYEECAAMMTWGFENFAMRQAVSPGDVLGSVVVKTGLPTEINAVAAEALFVPLRPDEVPELLTDLPASLQAPVNAGAELGSAFVRIDGQTLHGVPLVSDRASREHSLAAYLRAVVRHWLPAKTSH